MHHGGPFSIPAINNYIPEKVKPWIFIVIVIIIQFSGGLYLAATNEMVGGMSLMQQDVLMAGFASLIGMSLTFAIMLRLKMRFTSKFALITCCSVLIICNLISIYTNNIVVLIFTCFIAGIFRMWATFECNSTIQLWLTPKRDMSIFFCFIHLLVQGCILLSGITNMYVILFSKWQYMHWLIIGLLLIVIFTVTVIFNNKRFMKPFPLYGIDWLGALIWGFILLDLNFIFLYGDHYDWLSSWQIKYAFLFLIIMLPIQLYRASFIRHAYIPLAVFKYKAVYMGILIYLIIDILIAPANMLENIYFGKILGYDTTSSISLNWMALLGIVVGAIFSYFFFARNKNSFKSTFLIGFALVVVYLCLMYFLIDYTTTKEILYIPIFFRNLGYVIIAIVLQTNLMKVPFHHFFQGVSAQAFVSVAIGSAWGTCILSQLFKRITTEKFQLISSHFDSVNHQAFQIDSGVLSSIVGQHTLIVSLKEMYGVLIIGAFILGIFFILYRYPALPFNVYPRMTTIVKVIRQQLPSRYRLKH